MPPHRPAPSRTGHTRRVNFARDVLDAAPPAALALVERTRRGDRVEHTFGAIADRSSRLASTLLAQGAGRGRVVLLLIGARVEWVEAMAACWRIGATVLSCSEQLRPADLRERLAVTNPALILADERNRGTVEQAGPSCPVLLVPDPALYRHQPAPVADLDPEDPCLLTFTSGTSGRPKAVVHAQRYLPGQRLQVRSWLGLPSGARRELLWCTAAPGWSKSSRNGFLAAWLAGAPALLHDARFDPAERLAIAAEEDVTVWCMAPTEWRVMARRGHLGPLPALREAVAAGEALDAATVQDWQQATGCPPRDGYGQSETGQLTGNPPGRPPRPGSMGLPLPGTRLTVAAEPGEAGELLVDPASVPTFFRGYQDGPAPSGPWHTGDRVHQDSDGYLWFHGRTDDVIVSAGYRIGPEEVESVLAAHPAVAEVAVVGAPDPDRGQVVRAVVVLASESVPSAALAAELQDYVKARTAPYKYPRLLEFRTELPRTVTGKISRRQLSAAADERDSAH